MSKATNKATTAKSEKVSVRKLPMHVEQAFDDIAEFEASAFQSWLVIGESVWKGECTRAEVLFWHPERKGQLSKATTIMEAVAVGFPLTDEGDSADDENPFIYGSLNSAYEGAKAFLNGEEITVEEAKAKSQRKKATDKVTASALIKELGLAQAKKLALEILAK